MTLYGRIKRAVRAFTLQDLDKQMDEAFNGTPALSGVDVSATTAMTFSAFWNGVLQISQTVASLPLPIYRRIGETGRERDRTHFLYGLLNRKANPYMSALTWRETMTHHAIVWGNGYSYKARDRAGRVVAFVLLNPERTTVALDGGRPVYKFVGNDNREQVLQFDDVFHLPGLGFDGLRGYSVLTMARESLGVGLALQEFGARFFGQGTNVGGVVTRPETAPRLTPEAATRLKEDLKRQWEGLTNSNRLLLLEEGMKYEKTAMPLDDAQFLASKQFSIQDLARWLNMPPHKLKDLSRSTFSNIEQEQLSYLVDTIRPWLVRWESAVDTWLVPSYEAEEVFAEHVVDALLRGDIQTRYNAYNVARQNGVINANEWRRMENWNPIPGRAGEAYLVNGNMIPADTAGEEQTTDLEVVEQVVPPPTSTEGEPA